jgi:cell division initiation protein
MTRMDVTPQELRGSEIKEAFRGFNRDEVDDLLERAAATIENLTRQVQELESRASNEPPPLPSSRDDAEMLQRTLLLAQRAADDAVNEAQAHARQLVEESEARAQALVSEAESTARRIADGERRRLEEEITELSSRRDTLSSDADALEEYVSGYRERVRAAVEADLARIGNQTIEPPSARPEVHEVEIPVSRYDRPAEREPEPAPAPMFEAGPAESEPEPRFVPSYAETPRPSATQWPPPADTSSAEASSRTPSASVAAPPREEFGAPVAAASSPWLADVDAPGDNADADVPAPWDHLTAEHQPFPIEADAATAVAVEPKAAGGDELDDDAFFASLREAVRDEAPLGPREEASPFFDDDPVEERRGRFRRR